jgi:hypothetical protein
MPLNPCIDCGALISTEAQSCPKCKSSSPRGWTCGVCRWNGDQRPFSTKNGIWIGSFSYHLSCAERMLTPSKTLLCGGCSRNLTNLWGVWRDHVESLSLHCDECGHNTGFVNSEHGQARHCHTCGLPLMVWHDLAWSQGYTHHRVCAPSWVIEDEKHQAALKEESARRNDSLWKRLFS